MRYVAFLRAINVGGRIVKMDRLRTLFEGIPLANVETFIASGNVFFESKKARAAVEILIEQQLKTALGYDVATMVRDAGDLAAVVDRAGTRRLDPGDRLYVGFLKGDPSAQAVASMRAMSNAIDLLEIQGREVYWHCRKSWSESTVAGPKLEKALGQPVTFRNLQTVRKVAERLG